MNSVTLTQIKQPKLVNLPQEDLIYALDFIQPHGVLLVLNPINLNVLQVSDNTVKILKVHPENLLNQGLQQFLLTEDIQKIEAAIQQENLNTVNPLYFTFQSPTNNIFLEGIVHRFNNLLVLELEPAKTQANFTQFYHLVQNAIAQLRNTQDLEQLYEVAVQEIRNLTQLDRVMLYKFSSEGHGTVIAEAKRRNLKSLLGLNYPAFDIPQPVRQLFVQHGIRVIANAQATPAKITPTTNPQTQQPLDLSSTILRGVAPCHQEYMKNMRVAASVAIPLVQDEKLWGLIACHHQTPITFNHQLRSSCELLGQVISLELVSKKNREDYDYKVHLTQVQTQLLSYLTTADNWIEGLTQNQPNLLDLVNAKGAAIYLEGDCHTLGETPNIHEIDQLVRWLTQTQQAKPIFSTHSLAQLNPTYEPLKNIASGLLAIALSEDQEKYILWFRPEVIQTVKWAGNPQQAFQKGDNGDWVLSPRQSFELWKEAVRLTAIPWQSSERQAALGVREAILNVHLRQAEQLAKLNQALQASETREREKAQELETALAELSQTHNQLLATNTQLIQSEKMSSLGQLVAGVAHEINNPVNFIYGNIVHTENYIHDILHLLELYAEDNPSPSEELIDFIEDIELDFLVEDLPKMIGSMKLGASRIREIVQSLRNFSRLDESDLKSVNLHEGLESTLVILSNRLKVKTDSPGIHIIKEYGEIPEVECYPGPLNQVFMNLLANAIDVLEEYNEKRSDQEVKANPSHITLKTEPIEMDNKQWVRITIQDNGPGIPSEHLTKLFDPFFTTKPIGKGTGMGLAISHQIITEKHGGNLRCESDQGAKFIIELPVLGWA